VHRIAAQDGGTREKEIDSMHYPIPLLGGSHLLRALGIPADNVIGGLEDFRDQLGLQDLQDTFHSCAGAMGANLLANLLQSGGIPASMFMPPPNMGCCGCPHQYAQPQGFDFGASPDGNPFSLQGLMARHRGAQFEGFLRQNPFARAQVEMMLGGRIVPDGMNDGRIMVQPFGAGGGFPGGANPAAMSALGLLDQLSRGAMASGFADAFGPGMFQGLMMGALGNMLQSLGMGGGFPGFGGGGGGGFPGFGGPHQSGSPHPARGAFGIGEGGDASGVLNDPTLTVEDKVTLMIMLIMKKMDKDIEKQADYINKLQQQQNKGGKGGGGGKGGKGGGGEKSPSIDVETMKLKRMIDKRSQMFDMLRQIIDKYNQTAKGIIDSMGR
jgi:hypothetical protein